ncbi:MAG: hypothetical protein ACRC39_01730 [Enterobacter sp.]
MTIIEYFDDDEFIDEERSDSDDNVDTEDDENISGDDRDNEEDQDEDQDEDQENENLLPQPKYRIQPNFLEYDDVISLPIIDDFTDQELDLLPLAYIQGPYEQWSYIYQAIDSNFSQVKNLVKVNDKTLQIAADAAMLYVSKNIKPNQAFDAKNFPRQYYLVKYYRNRKQ